jgi:hypothetical protein
MGTFLIVRRPIDPCGAVPVSGVSPHIEGVANPGKSSTGPHGQANDGYGAVASGLSIGQLSHGELAMVGLPVNRFRVRLSGLETAAQSMSGRTSRSTRDRWRSCLAMSVALPDAGQLAEAEIVAEFNWVVGPVLSAGGPSAAAGGAR